MSAPVAREWTPRRPAARRARHALRGALALALVVASGCATARRDVRPELPRATSSAPPAPEPPRRVSPADARTAVDTLRPAHGRSELPVWAPLTPFEERALRGVAAARAGEPGAYLDLALFASGDVRDEAEAATLRARVFDAVARSRARVEAAKTARERAELAFTAMHRELLGHPDARAGLVGYEVEQSQLSVLLRTGRYNCISSALLFVVWARGLGVDVRGVILPSHASIEVVLPDGAIVAVETTSPTGFGVVYDAAFFARQASAFAKERGLPVLTPAEYAARRVVPTLDLVTLNMRNQHVSRERMAAADEARLAEARALVDPQSLDCQTSRASVLAEEYGALSQERGWSSIARMFDVVRGVGGGPRPGEPLPAEARRIEGALHAMYADALARTGREREALVEVDATLAWTDTGFPDDEAEAQNALTAVATLARARVASGDLDGADALHAPYSERCRKLAWCRKHEGWLAAKRAEAAWARADWEAAVEALARAAERLEGDPEQAQALSNLGGAYHNWAAEFLNRRDTAGAQVVLERCVRRFPALERCQETLRKLRQPGGA